MSELERILAQIGAIPEKIEMAVFFGRGYYHGQGDPWSVQLKLHDAGVRIEAVETGKSLADALGRAWGKIESIAQVGLPRGVLAPALKPPRDGAQ